MWGINSKAMWEIPMIRISLMLMRFRWFRLGLRFNNKFRLWRIVGRRIMRCLASLIMLLGRLGWVWTETRLLILYLYYVFISLIIILCWIIILYINLFKIKQIVVSMNLMETSPFFIILCPIWTQVRLNRPSFSFRTRWFKLLLEVVDCSWDWLNLFSLFMGHVSRDLEKVWWL